MNKTFERYEGFSSADVLVRENQTYIKGDRLVRFYETVVLNSGKTSDIQVGYRLENQEIKAFEFNSRFSDQYIIYNNEFVLIKDALYHNTISEVQSFCESLKNQYNVTIDSFDDTKPKILVSSGNSEHIFSKNYKSIIDFDYDKIFNSYNSLSEEDRDSYKWLFDEYISYIADYYMCKSGNKHKFLINMDKTTQMIKRLNYNINNR